MSETGGAAASNGHRKVMVNPHLKVIQCSEDEVVVKHGSRSRFSRFIRDEGRSRLLGRVLRNLTPPASLEALEEQGIVEASEMDDARRLVDYLLEEGILVPPEEDVTAVYLDTILGLEGRFAEHSVGLVGAGYLGSRIADELARLGLGKLVLLDDRKVQDEGLERRHFALNPAEVKEGLPYTECVAAHLEAWSGTEVETMDSDLADEDSLEALAGKVDFIIAALELYSAKTFHTVNAVMLDLHQPWMSVFVDGGEARIGPIYVPGETACYSDYEIQHEANLGVMKDGYLLYKEALNQQRIDGSHLTLAPYLSVATGMATTAVARFLLSGKSFLVERGLRVDFERLSVDFEDVLRIPRGPAGTPSRASYRHLFM